MKLFRFISAVAALAVFVPVFTSCDKDNNDEDEPSAGDDNNVEVVDNIAGTYSGSMEYSVGNMGAGPIVGEYEIKIIEDESDKDDVTVVIPSCSFVPPIPNAQQFTIPELTVTDVDVTTDGKEYTLEKDSFTISIDKKDYKGNKLTGTVKGPEINIRYQLTPGGMPWPIVFTFSGTLNK
ncbi:MAG: hypothetical protein K2H49_05350 [Muribaculaceae bacterium]|nr:hypothetical protein [Muribaculaceae bacterium]